MEETSEAADVEEVDLEEEELFVELDRWERGVKGDEEEKVEETSVDFEE